MARRYKDSEEADSGYNPYHELLDDPDQLNAQDQDEEIRQGMSIDNDLTLSNRTGRYYRIRSVHSKNDQARRDYLGY